MLLNPPGYSRVIRSIQVDLIAADPSPKTECTKMCAQRRLGKLNYMSQGHVMSYIAVLRWEYFY